MLTDALKTQATRALGEEIWGHVAPPTAEQIATSWQRYEEGARPELNPTQRQAFDNYDAKFFLLYGERASGKTIGALHMVVDRCFLNLNGHGTILTLEIGQAREGGAWDKLVHRVLPEWRERIGLQYTEPRLDPESKKPYVWIVNRYGYGSRISSWSAPVDEHVWKKIRGREYTIVLVDEAQTTDSDSYFRDIVQSVGRIPENETVGQTIYCANPEGPSHWLYRRFFEWPVKDAKGQLTDEWNADYAVYHVPLAENIRNLPPGYYDTLLESCRGDPVLEERLIHGRWVDRPSGDAIFKEYFIEDLHIRGDAAQDIGLLPLPGYVVIVSYDLGPAHSSIHMGQFVPTNGKLFWRVFDEIDYVGRYAPYHQIVPQILARMDYWNKTLQAKLHYDHIGPADMFTYQRQDGSLDYLTVQQLSEGRIVMRRAPGGKGSVAERIRMTMEMLQKQEVLISATCWHTKQMFLGLESKPGDAFNPRRSPHLHRFDSFTYGPLAVRVGGAMLQRSSEEAKVTTFGG